MKLHDLINQTPCDGCLFLFSVRENSVRSVAGSFGYISVSKIVRGKLMTRKRRISRTSDLYITVKTDKYLLDMRGGEGQ